MDHHFVCNTFFYEDRAYKCCFKNLFGYVFQIFLFSSISFPAAALFWSIYLTLTKLIHASSTLHSRMLTTVLRSPMAFFDTTPVGRILNRFVLIGSQAYNVIMYLNSKNVLVSCLLISTF